jgi:hypothetical protein
MPPYINTSEVFKVASAFYFGFARKKIKTLFPHSEYRRGQYTALELRVERVFLRVCQDCDHFCLEIHYI